MELEMDIAYSRQCSDAGNEITAAKYINGTVIGSFVGNIILQLAYM